MPVPSDPSSQVPRPKHGFSAPPGQAVHGDPQYPALHAQLKLPSVFVQVVISGHVATPSAHSSMSVHEVKSSEIS